VKTLGFTGDVGRRNMPIIRDPVFMGDVEFLISESTYGGVTHDPPAEMDEQLASVLRATTARGGKVIVPAFSVGRTQDLVYSLYRLLDRGRLSPIPVYVDSPLAINATEIYRTTRMLRRDRSLLLTKEDRSPRSAALRPHRRESGWFAAVRNRA
jgi:metallo-beta-lactamase family protein